MQNEPGGETEVQGGQKLSLEQIRAMLAASQIEHIARHSRSEVYAWVGRKLREQNRGQQAREPEGSTADLCSRDDRTEVMRFIGQHTRLDEVHDSPQCQRAVLSTAGSVRHGFGMVIAIAWNTQPAFEGDAKTASPSDRTRLHIAFGVVSILASVSLHLMRFSVFSAVSTPSSESR